MKVELTRPFRWALALLILAVMVATALAVPAVRIPTLRSVGWALVNDDPLQPVDVIVIAIDADGEGALEAADLIHQGIATRAAVFSDPPDAVDHEFLRRGLPYEDRAAVTIRQLASLGITNVERIPRSVAGTEDEARMLPGWCIEGTFSSVIVISTADHSHRLRRILNRSMKGHPTKVLVRASRYSQFDPDRWWETRTGARTGIIELQKLLLDLLRHPLS